MITMLHNYFRSSTSFRVRIALAMKNISYAQSFRHLRKGEQRSADYLAINPQGLVPTLDIDGHHLSQSMAILEYLEETHPLPPLLPKDAAGRARVRSLALMIACEIHPLGNLRVLADLRTRFGADDAAVAAWFRHWVSETFDPLERRLAREPETGRFCHGDAPTFADICLVPQVINNKRFDVDMQPYPTIARICEECLLLPAFMNALPERQPDAE
jgi:maleylpyruvate isomerase